MNQNGANPTGDKNWLANSININSTSTNQSRFGAKIDLVELMIELSQF